MFIRNPRSELRNYLSSTPSAPTYLTVPFQLQVLVNGFASVTLIDIKPNIQQLFGLFMTMCGFYFNVRVYIMHLKQIQ